MSTQVVPDSFVISKSRLVSKRVKLNVGGVRFGSNIVNLVFNAVITRHEVMWKMLEQVPHSRLGLLAKVIITWICFMHLNLILGKHS